MKSGTRPDWGDRTEGQRVPPVTSAELRRATEEEQRVLRAGARIVTWVDSEYPENLRSALSAPPVLYVKGGELPDVYSSVAIVGSRKATTDYKRLTTEISFRLAHHNMTIVSGLAKGIDHAAHIGALEAKGHTIAVLGHGLHTLYPADHRLLADRIVRSGGALVTFFPWGVPPRPYHFPARNFLIAGLSAAIVVAQGPVTSGALITANAGLSMGREIFAFPGSIGHPMSVGPHALLRDGAHFASNYMDILSVIDRNFDDEAKTRQTKLFPKRAAGEAAEGIDGKIKARLRAGPQSVTELVDKSGIDVRTVLSVLIRLELADVVIRHDDGRYSLVH